MYVVCFEICSTKVGDADTTASLQIGGIPISDQAFEEKSVIRTNQEKTVEEMTKNNK
ncbi:MAG TPA: hypothetical protein VNM69_20755 [Bacillus sp. (in: firmicutes)]|nr:hypothetical protein [Bacillus sp. (in: firmicutes)]